MPGRKRWRYRSDRTRVAESHTSRPSLNFTVTSKRSAGGWASAGETDSSAQATILPIVDLPRTEAIVFSSPECIDSNARVSLHDRGGSRRLPEPPVRKRYGG